MAEANSTDNLSSEERRKLKRREWRLKNREKLLAYDREYGQKHKEQISAKNKEYNKKIKNNPELKERWRKHRATYFKKYFAKKPRRLSPEEVLKRKAERLAKQQEKNEAKWKAYLRKWGWPENLKKSQLHDYWKQTKQERKRKKTIRCSAYTAKRRAKKRMASIGDSKLILKWEKQWRTKKTAICYWCGRRITTKQCHADHIVPLAKGGSHCIENLCIACKTCNSHKRDLDPHEFNKTLKQPNLIV